MLKRSLESLFLLAILCNLTAYIAPSCSSSADPVALTADVQMRLAQMPVQQERDGKQYNLYVHAMRNLQPGLDCRSSDALTVSAFLQEAGQQVPLLDYTLINRKCGCPCSTVAKIGLKGAQMAGGTAVLGHYATLQGA